MTFIFNKTCFFIKLSFYLTSYLIGKINMIYKSNLINFTLYPAHNRVGGGTLVLRHSISHFKSSSRGIACGVAKLNATLCLGTGAKKKQKKKHFVPLRHYWPQLNISIILAACSWLRLHTMYFFLCICHHAGLEPMLAAIKRDDRQTDMTDFTFYRKVYVQSTLYKSQSLSS